MNADPRLVASIGKDGKTVARARRDRSTLSPSHLRAIRHRPGTPLREALRVTAGNNPASRWLSCATHLAAHYKSEF